MTKPNTPTPRPHDYEETDAEREARFDAAALDVVARVSTGDPAHPFPYISDRYTEDPDEALRADRHAEITEATASEDVHRG